MNPPPPLKRHVLCTKHAARDLIAILMDTHFPFAIGLETAVGRVVYVDEAGANYLLALYSIQTYEVDE